MALSFCLFRAAYKLFHLGRSNYEGISRSVSDRLMHHTQNVKNADTPNASDRTSWTDVSVFEFRGSDGSSPFWHFSSKELTKSSILIDVPECYLDVNISQHLPHSLSFVLGSRSLTSSSATLFSPTYSFTSHHPRLNQSRPAKQRDGDFTYGHIEMAEIEASSFELLEKVETGKRLFWIEGRLKDKVTFNDNDEVHTACNDTDNR